MIVQGFKPVTGVHSESTTCRNLLAFIGLELSEPLVFGLGAGVGFTYLERVDRKTGLREPMVFGRISPGRIAQNLASSLRLKLVVEETVNRVKAWENLLRRLDSNKLYGLKLDMYYLDYLERRVHFNAHYVTACGYDEQFLYVVDVGTPEIRKTSLRGIEQGRAAKGFLSSRNLGFYFLEGEASSLEAAILVAIQKAASQMLRAESGTDGVKGMMRFAERLRTWKKHPNNKYMFWNHYIMWEKAGTGGSGFRRLYSEFLREASAILNKRTLLEAADEYEGIASDWTEISGLIRALCDEPSMDDLMGEISKKIRKQARLEEEVFKSLLKAIT